MENAKESRSEGRQGGAMQKIKIEQHTFTGGAWCAAWLSQHSSVEFSCTETAMSSITATGR